MTVDQMIQYLRLSVTVQDPSGAVQDTAYLSMTDEDILLYLNTALTRDFADVPSLEDLPVEYVYPLTLLAKKELYFTLAAKTAPLFDIGADNNNYLKRSQRFSHYMSLIEQVDKEYDKYKDDGGAGGNTLTSFDVLLSDRYATKRNYEKGFIPALTVYLGTVTDTTVELSWVVKRISRFYSYNVYVHTSPILDMHNLTKKISEEATLVATIKDVHQQSCRVQNLTPNTLYYILVMVTEMSSLKGYAETSVTTEESEV